MTKVIEEQPVHAPDDAALQVLEVFYPLHYKAGFWMEASMRGGELGRHQAVILWLIHSEGEGGRRINRKEIERHLSAWFEISGAAITKALRAMAGDPLNLLTLEEAAHSGREKVVTLTEEGETFVDAMVARGENFFQLFGDRLTEEEIVQSLHLFGRISEILDELR